jgi:preprotein translocase SecE subunit
MATMSVAENAPIAKERSPRSAQQQLALGSLAGALYVLFGLWIVLAGLPYLWDMIVVGPDGTPYMNEFLSATLLLMLCGAAAFGIAYIGYQLIRTQHLNGLRAGIFFAAVMIFLSLWIGEAIGNASERGEEDTMGLVIGGIITAVLLGISGFLFLQPGWGRLVESVDEQGWFHGTSFKANQGVRVRRGTVLGVLILGLCGIVTLILHSGFGSERYVANNWVWLIPGTAGNYGLPLMYKVHLVMPVLMGLALIVFSWRLVNVPVFADFLIATEAEMNKVSWTTRRRLIQDTIVVLVTVFLMTLFLFLVDIMWIQILSNPYVGVLQYNPREQQKQQQEKNQW